MHSPSYSQALDPFSGKGLIQSLYNVQDPQDIINRLDFGDYNPDSDGQLTVESDDADYNSYMDLKALHMHAFWRRFREHLKRPGPPAYNGPGVTPVVMEHDHGTPELVRSRAFVRAVTGSYTLPLNLSKIKVRSYVSMRVLRLIETQIEFNYEPFEEVKATGELDPNSAPPAEIPLMKNKVCRISVL